MLTNAELHKRSPWKRTFNDIQTRCNNVKSTHYRWYGAKGIECRITREELEQLWFRDKAYLMKQPSIDREDNDSNYEYDNCRYIEHSVNSGKDKFKPVLQYDLEGNFIREWASRLEATKALNITRGKIASCTTNKLKTASGFIWKNKED